MRKEINFCRKVGIPILGVVENMSGFVCPSCQCTASIFPPSSGGAQAMCDQMQVPYLGAIPLDPRIATACDGGQSFLQAYPDSPACAAYKRVVAALEQSLRSNI